MPGKSPPQDGIGQYQDIQSRHVDQHKRPHGEAEIDHRPVDRRRLGPFFQQPERLLQVGHEQPIDHEPFAIAHQHRGLAQRSGQPDRGSDHLGRRGLATNDLDQRHVLGRMEEVHAHEPLRMPHVRGQHVQVQGRRVGGDERLGRAHVLEPCDGRRA